MNKSEDIKELATALCKAQAKITGAIKDSSNPFFQSKYADLDAVWEAIRVPFTENNLSVSQIPSETEKGTILETVIMHSSGQWISGNILMKTMKEDPQSKGSAITYYRRYVLSAMSGVSQVDDDAESAMNRDIEIKDVKKVQPKGKAQHDSAPTPSAICQCGGEMVLSRYKKNELWCANCKTAKPV